MLGIWEGTKRIRQEDGSMSFFSERWPGEYELDGSGAYITKGTANNRDYRV